MMNYKKYYNYEVYENGKVYSHYVNRFLIGEVTKQGYLQYTLVNKNGKRFRIKAHRLVGELFLECPENHKDLVINHKDGNKLNNHFTNLEWTTVRENNIHARKTNLNDISASNHNRWQDKKWAEEMSKKLSEAALKSGCNKGEKNGRFRYVIYDKNNKKYSRMELAAILGFSQSYTDTIIRNLAKNIKINNKEIIEKGIYVIDIKKVNRLSKV